ncbi:MAG: ABC transporter permease, partial [Gemmatimonadaceae bacterium]
MTKQNSSHFKFPWRSRTNIANDVDTELSFHLEMRVNELIANGMGGDAARKRATEEFGDIEFTKAYCRNIDARTERSERTANRFAEWRQDVSYAWRTMRRKPSFAIVSLITLALAIGANTAIFSVARAVLLKPLPYGSPDELVRLSDSPLDQPKEHYQQSPANYADIRAQQHTLVDIGAAMNLAVTWAPDNGDPQFLQGVQVTRNMFAVLGVNAMLGRTFTARDSGDGNDQKVIISHKLWKNSLGSDSAAVGRMMLLGGRKYEIIGVMPSEFTVGEEDELWMPFEISDITRDEVRARKQHYLYTLGRLKPGVSLQTANADIGAIGRRLEQEYPDANSRHTSSLQSLRESLTGDFRNALLMLQAAAVAVLLIACANLANLTLSRTMGRRREMALRAALGAGSGRLVRQLLTESVMLSFVGGVLGVAIATIATKFLLALNPDMLPSMFVATIDTRVLLFSLALSIITGILFGLIPALDAARPNVHDSLKESGRGTSGGRAGERLRHGLVVAQVGLAVMLLIGAGLLVRSFNEISRVKSGFDTDHILTAQLRAGGVRYDSSSAVNEFYDAVLSEMSAVPGVTAVGASAYLPTRGHVTSGVRIVGEPTDEKNLPDIGYVSIRGDYFKVMHIPLLAGRTYNATDLPDGPKTAIINETAAHKFFPRGDAIGRAICIGPDPNGKPYTIVGIAGDIRDERPWEQPKPALYANHVQESWDRTMSILVRTSGDPQSVAGALRRIVKSNDPQLAVRNVRLLEDIVGS